MLRQVCVLVLLLPAPVATTAAAEKMKAEELLARHLEALGPSEARAAARRAGGPCAMSAPASGGVAGALVGRFVFESDATRSTLRMTFPSQTYPVESFSMEEGQTAVGFVLPGKRSALGHFLSTNEVLLREGLLGGALNARWPLLDLAGHGAKVSSDGTKKLDGRELLRLRYRARKGQGDLDVFLYFEPDTFRHVASVYRASRTQPMGTTMESSSSQSDVYLQLTETFAEFRARDGLVLPASWTIRYETQAQVSQHWKYELGVEGPGR